MSSQHEVLIIIIILALLQRKMLIETKNRTLKCLKWHYATLRSMKNVSCRVDGGWGICPLFSSPPRGIWQSPHRREFAIQGKKMLMPGGQPGGEGRGGGGLGVAGIDWCINHDDTHSLVLRMSTTVCKFERFSSRNVQLLFKESIGMTFKNKKKGNLWIKCHCSVISELIEVNVFLNGFKFNEICVYTYDLSKSNPRAYGFLISKEICMWYTRFFSVNRRCCFFGLFQT